MQKITSNQYTIREEYVGQIFHENVIIPLLSRMDDILLIHGAAFNLNEKTILIGGRGGVGKTSIALRACFHKSGSFITDDMAIIRSHCIYPNLNFPKIYQYNLVGEPQLQKRLMGSFSILRKIHWLLYSPLFRKPPRIRVRPDRIFDVGKAAKIDIYFIIERTNQINLFEYQKLNSTEAAGISAVIMQEELGQFKLEDHFSERYVTQFKAQLSKTEIYLVKVSDSMSHQKYLNHMESLILRLTKTKN